MKLRYQLEDEDISLMMQAAQAHAQGKGWEVAIAIADEGGHPLALRRYGAVAAVCAYIATEKARGAALGKRETARMEKTINEGRYSFLTVPVVQAQMEGGVPILRDGVLLGAIGVSGVKSADDAAIAQAGIDALVWPSGQGA